MAVVLQDLIEILRKEKIELVAGAEGLDHVVSFPHVVENQNVAEFLEGGEVVFTLGIALTETFTIDDLAKIVYERGASALILNVGPYIQQIPESIIAMGDIKGFPIFYMPWESYCPLVVKAITKEIVRSEESRTTMEIALKAVVSGGTQKELYEDALISRGWNLQGGFQVAAIKIIDRNTDLLVEESRLILMKKSLGMLFRAQNTQMGIINIKWGMALVFHDIYDDKMAELLTKIKKQLALITQENEKVIFTMGGHVQGIQQVRRSFQQAKRVISIYDFSDIKVEEGGILPFDDLGIYKLLLSIEDRKVLEEYYQSTIEPLVQYDAYHDTQLCFTLRYYLEYNGSVNRVADTMFVHRNTIGNQIHKIEEVIKADLSDWNERSRIMVGLMAERLLKS